MGGDEPYCYRCRQTYGCICTGKQFTSAGDMLKEVESKLDAAETLCSQMYQVFGSLTDDFDIFAHPLVQRAMTALEQRKAPDDLLPWPSKHLGDWRLEARKVEEEPPK